MRHMTEEESSSFEHKPYEQRLEHNGDGPLCSCDERGPLERTILHYAIATLVGGVFVAVAVMSYLILSQSSSWLVETESALVRRERDALQSVAYAKVQTLNEYFDEIMSDSRLVSSFCARVLDGNITSEPLPSYNGVWDEPPDGVGPDPNPKLNRQVNTNHDAWYLPALPTRGTVDGLDSSLNDTAALYHVSRVVYNAHPLYTSMYVGFEYDAFGHDEIDGLFRIYPFRDLSHYIYAHESVCSWSGETIYRYDPTCRPWYYSAKVAESAVLSPPYVDASGLGLMISPAIPVYHSGQFVGIAGADVGVGAIEEEVVSTKVLENGYGYLIDLEGSVVVHPDLDRDLGPQTVGDLEFSSKEDYNDFKGILSKMTELEAGEDVFQRDGTTWYIAYSPVVASKFSFAVVVPASDIMEPADELVAAIQPLFLAQVSISLIIVVVLSIGSLLVSRSLAHAIVAPIHELTHLVRKVTAGDLTTNLKEEHPGSLELKNLHSTFRGLLISLRFGNSSFMSGNLKKAQQSYAEARALFRQLNNAKGVGICENNLGTVMCRAKEYERAEAHFLKAIHNAEDALRNTCSSYRSKLEIQRALSTRKANLAEVYVAVKQYERAGACLRRCLEIDDETENMFDKVTHLTAYAEVLYLLQVTLECDQVAREAYMLAFNTEPALPCWVEDGAVLVVGGRALRRQASMKRAKNQIEALEAMDEVEVCMRQAASLAVGISALAHSQPNEAALWFAQAIEYGPVVNQAVRAKASHYLNRVLYMKVRVRPPKDVALLMDYSGSMAGPRVNSCVDSMITIFDDHINMEDRVAYFLFASAVTEVFSYSNKGSGSTMRDMIDTHRTPSGRTAFYDALGAAIRGLKRIEAEHRQQWVIAVTDGLDTASRMWDRASVQQAAVEGQVSLIVLFIGTGDCGPLKDMCLATRDGCLIRVESEGAISRGLAAVADVVSWQTSLVLESY